MKKESDSDHFQTPLDQDQKIQNCDVRAVSHSCNVFSSVECGQVATQLNICIFHRGRLPSPPCEPLFSDNKKTYSSVFCVLCACFHLEGNVWRGLGGACGGGASIDIAGYLALGSDLCCAVCVAGFVRAWLDIQSSVSEVCVRRQKVDLCQFSQCEPQWGHLELGGPKSQLLLSDANPQAPAPG